MKIKTNSWTVCVLAATIAAAAASCNEDPESMDAGDGGPNAMCDPVGANPQMGALLNAPVADDVEVIVKTPQHPGPVGPEGLP